MATTITRDIDCPECGLTIETDFDPAEPDLEVTCPDCQEVIPYAYDATADTIQIMEYEDEDGPPEGQEIEIDDEENDGDEEDED